MNFVTALSHLVVECGDDLKIRHYVSLRGIRRSSWKNAACRCTVRNDFGNIILGYNGSLFHSLTVEDFIADNWEVVGGSGRVENTETVSNGNDNR